MRVFGGVFGDAGEVLVEKMIDATRAIVNGTVLVALVVIFTMAFANNPIRRGWYSLPQP